MTNNGKNGRKRRRRIILGIIILLVLVGAGIGVTAALRPNHQIDPAKLAIVERGDIARSVVATGKVQPLAKVEIKSKASGIVKQIFVDYGDRVKAGQVLVELDKEALRASVREARATLQATQAAQEAAEATYERNVVEAEGPDMPFLKASMGRAHQLHKDGLIAQSVLEDAEKAYQMGLNKQMTALRNTAVSRAEEIGRASCRERGWIKESTRRVKREKSKSEAESNA